MPSALIAREARPTFWTSEAWLADKMIRVRSSPIVRRLAALERRHPANDV
jgi:hypothetical protein